MNVNSATRAPQNRIQPLETYPVDGDNSLNPGGGADGWAGINKPFKVKDEQGDIFVAKSNTLGAFIGLHPDHDTRKENVHEIVTSHIVADEFKLPSLTFQEGYFNTPDGQHIEKVLSPFKKDFDTLENVPVKSISDGDQAVRLAIVCGGLMGDWDSTFNDSNLWVRKADHKAEGSDYGYAAVAGNQTSGIPYGNIKIMNQFATEQNVNAAVNEIRNLSDEQIHGMVERQGSQWIHDWSPAMEADISGAMIANRDALRKDNPYTKYVEGFHPLMKRGQLLKKLKYPVFFFKASKAQWPPLKRPDQWLDVFGAVASYAHMKKMASVFHWIRGHVHSPAEKAAQKS